MKTEYLKIDVLPAEKIAGDITIVPKVVYKGSTLEVVIAFTYLNDKPSIKLAEVQVSLFDRDGIAVDEIESPKSEYLPEFGSGLGVIANARYLFADNILFPLKLVVSYVSNHYCFQVIRN